MTTGSDINCFGIICNFSKCQDGAVLLLMLVVMVLGSTFLILSEINAVTPTLKKHSQVSKILEDDIVEALYGYAVVYKRLPCPDTNGDGISEIAPCNNIEGELPWATLGVKRTDSWGRPFRYRGNSTFTVNPIAPLAIVGELNILDKDNLPIVSAADANSPAAIVFSCGINGIPDGINDSDGAPNSNANCINPGAPTVNYVSGDYSIGGFDDILLWLPRDELIAKMLAANKWP